MEDLEAQLAGLYAAPTGASQEETELSKLLYAVSELGGTATLAALAEAVPGVKASTIEVACAKPEGDKRKQPLMRAQEVGGVKLVILTSAGWSATGRTSKREQRPDATRLAHTLAPQRIAGEMKAKQERMKATSPGVEVPRISVGINAAALNEFGAKVSAAAWGKIQDGTHSDQGGLVGQLTQASAAPRPDAIVREEWPQRLPVGGREPWEGVPEWDNTPPGQVCEITALLEIETSLKATDAMKDKVRRLNTALSLGVADVVVWAIDDLAVGHRVWRRVIAEDQMNGPRLHRFVPLNLIDGTAGMSAPMPQGSQGWWITDH